MSQLFTVLFIFSHFIVGLPKPADVQTLPKAQLVQMYSTACLDFFKRKDVKGADGTDVIQSLVQSMISQPSVMGWLEGKGHSADVVKFYSSICKVGPDLTALDAWDSELRSASQDALTIERELPNIGDVRQVKLPQATELISSDGKVVADLAVRGGRRKNIKIDELPAYVPSTFVALEDARFYEHEAIDEVGIMRALMKDMKKSGGRQGASTITQQVAKNLYLTPEQTMKRKMQEILIADKISKQISKKEILELYLNLIYFGRNAWGIEKASQSYFGKSAKELSKAEAAFLAGIVHGPNMYRHHPERVESRVRFVFSRMQENGVIPTGGEDLLLKSLKITPEQDAYNAGFYRDYVMEQSKKVIPAGLPIGTQIRTSLNSKMQIATTEALQEGLINYEKRIKHRAWEGKLSNITDAINRNAVLVNEAEKLRALQQEASKDSFFAEADSKNKKAEVVAPEKPWLLPLIESENKFPIPVAKWQLAVVLNEKFRIGMSDGREGVLSPQSIGEAPGLAMGDIFYVRPVSKGVWEPVQPPLVEGAAIMMDTSGRVLAMAGGFSYAMKAGWNRAVQAMRQPGSLIKPFTYLAALQKGIQPNTLLSDKSITFGPIGRGGRSWTPANFSGEMGGTKPMRWALENSHNVMTASLMRTIGLDPICDLTERFGLYDQALRDYSFILGSQETNLLSLVKSYGEIANGGYSITPGVIDQIIQPGNQITVLKNRPGAKISGVDDVSLFQLRSMLQGVVDRGTANRLKRFSGVLAGKTGTTNDSKDGWFIGFTSRLIIGVWVGYDIPESLGAQTTGAVAALPIFERIFTESIKNLYLPEPFPAPPAGVVLLSTNQTTGQIQETLTSGSILEAYREGSISKEKK